MSFIKFAQLFGDLTLTESLGLYSVIIITVILLFIMPALYSIYHNLNKKPKKFKWYNWFCLLIFFVGMFGGLAGMRVGDLDIQEHFNPCTTSFNSTASSHVTIDMSSLITTKEQELINEYLDNNPVNVTICQKRETLKGKLGSPFVESITIDKNNSIIRKVN